METNVLFEENAAVVTCCPGRLRLHVPGLYRSAREKSRIEATLARDERIDAVYANPLTGKVLILFHFSIPVNSMLVMLGLVTPTQTEATHSRVAVPPSKSKVDRSATQESRKREVYPPWHLRDAHEALSFHGSSAHAGLSPETAEERLRQGRNVLPQPSVRSSLDILLGQFRSLPVLLLGASAVLSVLTGGVTEALAIAAVLAMNAGIGFVTERRAESTIASLSELVDDTAPVIRGGTFHEIEASRVVAGDILVLAPGVRVAADSRIVQGNGIAVDESALTGESHPAMKDSIALPADVPLAERTNMAYMGTVVAAGTGLAVVVGTGRNTEIGVVQSLMESTRQPKTPIQKQLDRLGNQLVAASIGVCAGGFAIGLLRGFGWLQMLKASISLAIAAVPEGLPTVATTSLARSIRSMKGRQMLVRRLQAVETLGAIHTMCLDKTGTLTLNRMSVVEVQLNGTHYAARDGALHVGGKQIDEFNADPALSRLLQVCALCSEGEVKNNGASRSVMNGSATENALVALAIAAGMPVAGMRARHALVHAELRGNGRNYMTTVRTMPDPGRHLVTVKGSPAEVLALCGSCLTHSGASPLTAQQREALLEQNRRMAERQLRVLGFACAEVDAPANGDATSGLTWLGLAGLADPLRAGAQAVIADLHRAGIRTAMVTGDQSTTALAIGAALGLANEGTPHVLEPDRLEHTDPQALTALVAQADIFARISPEHKLKIVRALQAGGDVVAMTGDGINDGPALLASDVGIAMGRHGTDLARSAADVVLEDDRLETVLEAIREGRTLTTNIRKALHFLISSNMSELMVVLGALSAGAPSPLTPMQLLWVNLLGDVLPAIALAAEPAESDLMQQPPRDASRPLIGRGDLQDYAREGLILSGGTLAAYLYGLMRYGAGARAGTIAFNALTLGQLLHALSCRSDQAGKLLATQSRPNNRLNMAIAGSIGLQLLANVVPGLRRLLGVAPSGAMDMVATLAGAGLPLLLNETIKAGTMRKRADCPASVDHHSKAANSA